MCVSNWSMKWCFQLDSINLVLKSCGMNNNKARSNFSLYFNFAERTPLKIIENYMHSQTKWKTSIFLQNAHLNTDTSSVLVLNELFFWKCLKNICSWRKKTHFLSSKFQLNLAPNEWVYLSEKHIFEITSLNVNKFGCEVMLW